MKKIRKIILLFFSIIFLFSGCNTTKDEIKNRLIVQAIGVDAIENGVRVTLQTLNNEMTGNPNSGANLGDIIYSITVEGDSISGAISNAAKRLGKKPLLSQNRMVVFGKETAQKGLYPYLDYFVRSSQNRATVLVAVSNTTAEDLVSTKMGESILPANSLEEILEANSFHLQIAKQQLYQFVNRLENPNIQAFLPIINTEKKEGEEGEFVFDSVGVFQNDKLKYIFKNDQISTLLFLNNQIQGGTFSFQNPQFQTKSTAQIIKSKTKLKSTIHENQISFKIIVRLTIRLIENESATPYILNDIFLQSGKAECEDFIESMLQKNVEESIVHLEVDPFTIGHMLSLQHPFFYKKNHKDWFSLLQNADFSYDVQAEISNIGLGTENF